MKRRLVLALPLSAVAFGLVRFQPMAAQGAGGNGITPGEFLVDPPTLINLGFEWLIDGDANRNAAVEVSYRKTGETTWRAGAAAAAAAWRARSSRASSSTSPSPNMFAGSILDLEPDTELRGAVRADAIPTAYRRAHGRW